MQKKNKKRRMILWIISAVLLLLLVIVSIPIITLYTQYQSLSYVPSDPVDRTDEYEIPDSPEITPGSEGITDIPDEPEAPDDATEDTTAEAPEPEGPAEETTEALPSVVNPPPSTKPSNNPENSFANSSNAINVYGRTPIYKVDPIDENVINILVLGTDSQDVVRDRGRSDTMIVVSYNKKTGDIKLVSMLRDMLVPIEGYDWNRINTAYFFDGVGLAINTVNQLFGLDIQHFLVVDFNAAKSFIDYIGGIKLTLSKSEAKFAGVEYSPDPIHLSGSRALAHMRNRSTDNDFGRTERQREVIVAVFNKIIYEKSLTEILDIAQYAMGMIKTNISATKLASLATSVVGNARNLTIETQSLPYSDAYSFGWYKKMAIISFDIPATKSRLLSFLY